MRSKVTWRELLEKQNFEIWFEGTGGYWIVTGGSGDRNAILFRDDTEVTSGTLRDCLACLPDELFESAVGKLGGRL